MTDSPETAAPEKRSYKKTLNLPKTAFPMKANLVQNEAASQKRWDQLGVYAKLRERAAAQKAKDDGSYKPFVFHDGPPYANGDIHLGHLLNKCLKDFVVRSRTMLGDDCPYTPGWDCHGLPIEHKVMQDLGDAARSMEPLKIRQKCKNLRREVRQNAIQTDAAALDHGRLRRPVPDDAAQVRSGRPRSLRRAGGEGRGPTATSSPCTGRSTTKPRSPRRSWSITTGKTRACL